MHVCVCVLQLSMHDNIALNFRSYTLLSHTPHAYTPSSSTLLQAEDIMKKIEKEEVRTTCSSLSFVHVLNSDYFTCRRTLLTKTLIESSITYVLLILLLGE